MVSWLGHVAHPEASGKLSLAGVAVQPGLPGTRGALARHPGRWSRARHSGQVSHSEGWSGRGGFRQRLRKEAFGTGSGWFRKAYRSGFGDTCHLPKGLRKRGCVGLVSERGFRKALSLGWHRVVRLVINGWDHLSDRTV